MCTSPLRQVSSYFCKEKRATATAAATTTITTTITTRWALEEARLLDAVEAERAEARGRETQLGLDADALHARLEDAAKVIPTAPHRFAAHFLVGSLASRLNPLQE